MNNKPFTSLEKPGLNDLMKRAQELQKKMQDIQKKIAALEITGQSGGGLVKITMNGQHHTKKVTLDPNVLKEELSVIEDLIAAAINDTTSKIEGATREHMSSITDIKLPDVDLPT